MKRISSSLIFLALFAGASPGQAASPEVDRAGAQDDAALRSALDEVVNRTNLAHARAGILVVSLDDGRLIYAHDAEELLNPASNVKLFTASAALSKLGPDYRWTTDFLLREPMKPTGEIKDLYVRGTGDPLMSTEKLYDIVSQLYHQGIRSVTGNLIMDDSYFDDDRIGPGFDQESSDRAYMAPAGALSLNSNAVEIDVFPGPTPGSKARVEIDPPSDYFTLDNQVSTIRSNQRGRIQIKGSLDSDKKRPDNDKEKLQVSGRVPIDNPGSQTWRKVSRPDLYFGYTLKALLAQRGIKVKGRIRRGPTPSDAKVLYAYEGDPLDLAVRKMDKTSSNFIAEQLVKIVGAQVMGVPGSWSKGVDAIEDFLEQEVQIPRGSYVMKNGSGLNDTNRFSAAQIVKLLTTMYKHFDASSEFIASMGVVGKDGTVRSRMEGTEAAGRIRAKTGTLESVCALSGFVESVGGKRFAFAMLVNDYPGKHAETISALDDLGVALASAGGATGPGQVANALVAQSTPLSSPDDQLRARVATYLNLGKLRDKHNEPFLRTALRTERDPALKAVVAEALYRSDPDDSSGVRAVLDTWSPGPEVFVRLRTASQVMGVEVPVVASLLDIAAEGNPEALTRVLELAPAAKDDPALTRELSDGLEEVSHNAADELLAALKAAPPEVAQAGVLLLARGIAASSEPESPFLPALHDAQQEGKDPEMAAFAKALEPELTARLAEAREALKAEANAAAMMPSSSATQTSVLAVTPVAAPGPAQAATPAPSSTPKPGG